MEHSVAPIVYVGHPILRKKAALVTVFDDSLALIVQQLKETVSATRAWGLAAPQIGHSLAVFAACFPDGNERYPGPPTIFINPKLSDPSDDIWEQEEGCLSFPALYAPVARPRSVTIDFQDEQGVFHKERLEEWPAKIVMHENDHLNGVLFIDRVEPRYKKRMLHSLEKLKHKATAQNQQFHHIL